MLQRHILTSSAMFLHDFEAKITWSRSLRPGNDIYPKCVHRLGGSCKGTHKSGWMEGDARFGVIILNIHIIIRPRAVLAEMRIRIFNYESGSDL